MSIRPTRLSHIGLLVVPFLALLLTACGGEEPPTLEPGSGAILELSLSSSDFDDMDDIPVRFTCDGEDQSPNIEWGPLPQGTESVVIIVDDPEAPSGIFNHWLVYDVPIGIRGLAAGQPRGDELPSGGLQGTNDAGVVGWSGPCPPAGPAHKYDFFLYAVMSRLDLEPGAERDEVAEAMRNAGVIGVGKFSGLYARQ